MAKLILRQRGGLSVAFDASPGARVGRDKSCEISLADSKASRHHATLSRDENDRWRLTDEGSRHGSFVNGKRVSASFLEVGDVIQIGSTMLEFSDSDSISEFVSTPHVGPVADKTRLQLFYGLAQAARSIEDRELVLEKTLQSIVRCLGAERGVIATTKRAGAPLRRVAVVNGDDIVVSRQMIDAVINRGESVLMREHGSKPTPDTLQAQGIRAAIAAPLRRGETPFGFIYLDSLNRHAEFGDDDLELVSAIAMMAAAIYEAAAQYNRTSALAESVIRAQPAPVILGQSAPILEVRRDIERLAGAEIAIHIVGESGVGKELVARALHAQSDRHAAPMVALNCAALPDNLIESELFGYARGAFTGAATRHRGKFALADGGTLFLDEVAELSASAQAKILRVLEDGEVFPLGSDQPMTVDVRVVSASHKKLQELVESGEFRQDLFYRLVVAEIAVPPLRDRDADVLLLASSFLSLVRGRGRQGQNLSEAAQQALVGHHWPGNVRELRNVIERASALSSTPEIDVDDLRLRRHRSQPATTDSLAEQFAELDHTEKRLVELALKRSDGNVSAAARLLGISRIMMKRRLERFSLAT